MIRLAVIAAIGTLTAVGMAQGLTHQAAASQGPAPAATPSDPSALRGPEASDLAAQSANAPPGAAELTKAADGHYWAEAEVNGAAVHFLVDTGATDVALTNTDAQRLGLNPAALVYDIPVTTANGEGRAARVRLASLSVGSARVENVDAMVVQRGLSNSLLGMSYLGRLSQFEATPRALILRP